MTIKGKEELLRGTWRFEIEHIPAELRDIEAELMQSRWFDYRQMLPLQATELFAQIYNDEYRKWAGSVRDIERAGKLKDQLKPLQEESSANLLCTWRSRQCADKIGCKYEFYIRFAFKRALNQLWKYIPRVNQLYSEEVMLDVRDAWMEESRVSLQLAKDDFYKVSRFVGHPDQTAYHDYLIAQAKMREHPHMMISRVVFREKVLPAEIAAGALGHDVLRRAMLLTMWQ